MSDPNNIKPEERYRTAPAERGKFWEVDDDYLTSLGYPASGEGKYAILTYQINDSSSLSGGSTAEFPTTIINGSITLTNPAEQAITAVEGAGTVTLRINAGDSAYVGATGVTSANGLLLDDTYPIHTMTLNDLRNIFVVGTGTLNILATVV